MWVYCVTYLYCSYISFSKQNKFTLNKYILDYTRCKTKSGFPPSDSVNSEYADSTPNQALTKNSLTNDLSCKLNQPHQKIKRQNAIEDKFKHPLSSITIDEDSLGQSREADNIQRFTTLADTDIRHKKVGGKTY